MAMAEFHPFQTGADRGVVLPLPTGNGRTSPDRSLNESGAVMAAPDSFRLRSVSWRCFQLCPGSGRSVENVRYSLICFALTTTTTMADVDGNSHQINSQSSRMI